MKVLQSRDSAGKLQTAIGQYLTATAAQKQLDWQKSQAEAMMLQSEIEKYGGIAETAYLNPDLAEKFLIASGVDKKDLQGVMRGLTTNPSAQTEYNTSIQQMAQNREGLSQGQTQTSTSAGGVTGTAQQASVGDMKSAQRATVGQFGMSGSSETGGFAGGGSGGGGGRSWGDTILNDKEWVFGEDAIGKTIANAYGQMTPEEQKLAERTLKQDEVEAIAKSALVAGQGKGGVDVKKEIVDMANRKASEAVIAEVKAEVARQGRNTPETLLIQLSNSMSGKTLNELEDGLYKENGGTRSAEYMSGTYKGDLAKEYFWNMLTDDEKVEVCGIRRDYEGIPKQVPKVSMMKESNLSDVQKEVLGIARQEVEKAQVLQKQYDDEFAAELRKGLGISDSAKTEGVNMAAKVAGTQAGKAMESPDVKQQVIQTTIQNPSVAQQTYQYYKQLKTDDRDLYYALLPQNLSRDIAVAEMDQTKANTRQINAAARKMERLLGASLIDPQTGQKLKVEDLELATMYAELQSVYMQMALKAAAEKDPKTAGVLGTMTVFADVYNKIDPKGDNKKAMDKMFASMFDYIANSPDEWFSSVSSLLSSGFFGGLKQDVSLTPQTSQRLGESAASTGFLSSLGIQ